MNSIGRYQLVEKLGQGGMGVVYRAFDTLLQRVVAVKIISGASEPGSEQRERFFREARAAGQLSHRNIITIHDLGEHEGQPYLAMEFLEGEDLLHRLSSPSRMSLAQKVDLALEICEGLSFAHAGGVVHRDIKPANIFITTSGTAKILDFGLARLSSSDLTNSNMIMGTIDYMAPEQVRGERVDHRADIFSLGVLLYELFGGRKAFHGDSLATTLYKILHELPEPLRQIDPNLPQDLVGIVNRALAKPLDQRYQHVADLLKDLKACRRQLADLDAATIVQPAPGALPPHAPASAHSHAAYEGPTIARQATQMVPHGSLDAGTGSQRPEAQEMTPAPARGHGSGSRNIWVIAAATVVVVSGIGLWIGMSPRSAPAAPEPVATAETTGQDEAVAAAVRRAVDALENGDPFDSQRHADAALALAPGHAEANRIRQQATDTIEQVSGALADARSHFQAGRFEEASRAAGALLTLAPGHQEARQLMQDASSRLSGRGATDARQRMTEAKNAARAAGATNLAAPAYTAALNAERQAQRAYDSGDLAGATAMFYEASGLFRSAEVSAQSEAAARTERAQAARAEPQDRAAPAAPAREPLTTPAAEPQPAAPMAAVPEPQTIDRKPVAAPEPPAAAAPPPPATPSIPPKPSPESLIADVLRRYEAALENRSLAGLKRLWPGLGGAQESAIRNEFERASRIDVELSKHQIEVAGETATATFIRQYEVTIGNQRFDSRSLTRMSLRRSGDDWLIEDIRFEPIR
jgi:hypothetical protein